MRLCLASAILTVLLPFAAAPQAWAQELHTEDVTNCAAYPDVPVEVTPIFDEPKYDYSQDLNALQQLSSDAYHSIPENDAVALGLTHYEPVLAFHIPIEVKKPPDGVACAYVKRVDVDLGYRNVTVYVAREVPPGSCGYREILLHEWKHVNVNRELLLEYLPLIKQRFKDYLRLYGVLQVPDVQYADKVMRERLSEIANKTIEEIQQENVRRQQAVDSPAEYQRLSNVCGGQLMRVAEKYAETGK